MRLVAETLQLSASDLSHYLGQCLRRDRLPRAWSAPSRLVLVEFELHTASSIGMGTYLSRAISDPYAMHAWMSSFVSPGLL
jgi:hypothetical protein